MKWPWGQNVHPVMKKNLEQSISGFEEPGDETERVLQIIVSANTTSDKIRYIKVLELSTQTTRNDIDFLVCAMALGDRSLFRWLIYQGVRWEKCVSLYAQYDQENQVGIHSELNSCNLYTPVESTLRKFIDMHHDIDQMISLRLNLIVWSSNNEGDYNATLALVKGYLIPEPTE